MMRDDVNPTATKTGFIGQVRALRSTLAPVPLLEERRAVGMGQFARAGLPTGRVEAWKFTNLRGLDKLSFGPAPDAAGIPIDAIPTALDEVTPRLVFVAGQYRADLSRVGALPDGVLLDSLSAAMNRDPSLVDNLSDKGNAFRALNNAFLSDGAFLRVADGVRVASPIELVFVAATNGDQTAMWHPRLLIEIGAGAEATIVEHHVGAGAGTYVSNVAGDVTVGKGGRLHHYKLQAEGMDGVHLADMHTVLADDAVYDGFVLNLGAKLARHEARLILDGQHVEARISGAYAIGGHQVSDITTLIDHAKPHGTSREVVKGVIDGQAKGVFQGKIIVRPDAQKTDGHQLNRALLLSDNAEINAKPELEIYADDVKCSHGATAGELDEQQMFYLRARGIPRDAARVLLIGAFLDEALDEIRNEQVRDYFRAQAETWMGARGA